MVYIYNIYDIFAMSFGSNIRDGFRDAPYIATISVIGLDFAILAVFVDIICQY